MTYIEDNWNKVEEDPEVKKQISENLQLLKKELTKEEIRSGLPFESAHQLNITSFNEIILNNTANYIKRLDLYYNNIFNKANAEKEAVISYLLNTNEKLYNAKRDAYHNESVEEQVTKRFEKNKIVQYRDELIQQKDPVFRDPDIEGYFNFRSHFFAPRKYFAGRFHETFWFNHIFIWVMTIFLYFTLYYELLKKLLELPEKIKFRK